jgi:hypothetical protein
MRQNMVHLPSTKVMVMGTEGSTSLSHLSFTWT